MTKYISLTKCPPPKIITNHAGMCYEPCDIVVEGVDWTGYLEVTRGEYVYVSVNNKTWRKFRFEDYPEVDMGIQCGNAFDLTGRIRPSILKEFGEFT